MDAQWAQQLASDFSRALALSDADLGIEPRNMVLETAFRAVRPTLAWVVPEVSQGAVLERRGEAPVVALAGAAGVFVVELAEIPTDRSGTTRVRLIPPADGPSAEAVAAVSEGFGTVRGSINWTFHLGNGETLAMTSGLNGELGHPQPEHLLALELAERLGWTLPELSG